MSKVSADVTPPDITLDLSRIEDLFQAPDANPFSARPVDVLGQSGMDYLRKRFTRLWFPRRLARGVVIRLPAGSLVDSPGAPGELASSTRAAIERYCTERVAANRDARRLAMLTARGELLIAAAVTIVALAMLGWFAFSQPAGAWRTVAAVATIFAVFAAALAIWDALESWFFDWTPFAVENAAYRWISRLQVRIAPQTANQTADQTGEAPGKELAA